MTQTWMLLAAVVAASLASTLSAHCSLGKQTRLLESEMTGRRLQQAHKHLQSHSKLCVGLSTFQPVQLVAKATFARERAASAGQQVQHLTALGLTAQASSTARTQAAQQQLLTVRPTQESAAVFVAVYVAFMSCAVSSTSSPEAQ